MELSYILGNENSKQNYYISGNGTLLYFWKQIPPPPPAPLFPNFIFQKNRTFLYLKKNFQIPEKQNFL